MIRKIIELLALILTVLVRGQDYRIRAKAVKELFDAAEQTKRQHDVARAGADADHVQPDDPALFRD